MFSFKKSPKVEHEVTEGSCCCCFSTVTFKMTKEDTGKTVKRKCIKSTTLRWTVVANFLVICGIITGIDFVLKGWLMEFSTGDSEYSIKNIQDKCPLWLYTSLRL